MFAIFGRKKGNGFWDWLATNTARIQGASGHAIQRLGEEIREVFGKSFPGLVWEITRAPSPPWIFCISADGDVNLFPRVQDAVSKAPTVPGWFIQAFRPRGNLNVVLEMGAGKLGYEDVWCSVEPQDGGLHVTLWIRGLTPQSDKVLSGGAAILLDNAIGEYDAGTKIKQLDRGPLPANPQQRCDFFPLSDLPLFLDGLLDS